MSSRVTVRRVAAVARARIGRSLESWGGSADRRRSAGLLMEAVAGLPVLPDLPPPGQWSLARVVPTETDVTVAEFSAPGHGTVAIGRIAAEGPTGQRHGFLENNRNLERLRADPRIGDFALLLPRPLAVGQHGGRVFAVESSVAGRSACPGPIWSSNTRRTLGLSAAAISVLHERTATEATVGDDQLERWVGAPLRAIRLAGKRGGWGPHAAALGRIERELRSRLAGRVCAVAWAHGDLWCGNILLDDRGERVVGVVDWDSATPVGLAIVDLYHLILTTTALERHVDLGVAVREVVGGHPLDPEDRRLVDRAGWSLPAEPGDGRVLALLAWLCHVTAVLGKGKGYASNRRWLTANVGSVLSAV